MKHQVRMPFQRDALEGTTLRRPWSLRLRGDIVIVKSMMLLALLHPLFPTASDRVFPDIAGRVRINEPLLCKEAGSGVPVGMYV